ncbi:MAG: aminopeptidase P family protein [Armatimonadetes bacterium]|nr:aminopeptidase P family protein [Armatimonadota bacterium]
MIDDPLDAAKKRMAQEAIDLLAIPPGDDLFYLLSYSPHLDERPCYLFLTQEDALFLVPELNATAAAPHVPFPTLTYTDADGPEAALREVQTRLGRPRQIAAGDTMRADALLLLQERWPEARFVPGARVMAPVRMIKTAEEIMALRRAAATADVAVRTVFDTARPGQSEREVARIAEEAFRAQGVQEVPSAIAASGPNSAYPHHQTSDRLLAAGEPLLLDVGGRLDGYMSDITRMAFLGEPATRYREVHAIVEEAVTVALGVIRPGTPIREVDRAARGVIERAGYGAHFTHRTGHGIGVTGHEPPSITHTNDLPLAVGMAFSVEPGIYLVGEFGVRLEEIVVVTERGGERLSALGREVQVI